MKYMDVYGVEHETPSFQFKPRTGLFLDPKMIRKKALFTSIDQNWTTPLHIYERIKKERGIVDNYDTDPATSESNPLGCKLFYTEKDNGLKQKWNGKVFINPPFSGHYKASLWIEEAWLRTQTEKNPEVSMVTMLIPARTDTVAFHTYIYKQANVKIEFIKGRIKFGNSKTTAPFPSMICDFYRT